MVLLRIKWEAGLCRQFKVFCIQQEWFYRLWSGNGTFFAPASQNLKKMAACARSSFLWIHFSQRILQTNSSLSTWTDFTCGRLHARLLPASLYWKFYWCCLSMSIILGLGILCLAKPWDVLVCWGTVLSSMVHGNALLWCQLHRFLCISQPSMGCILWQLDQYQTSCFVTGASVMVNHYRLEQVHHLRKTEHPPPTCTRQADVAVAAPEGHLLPSLC